MAMGACSGHRRSCSLVCHDIPLLQAWVIYNFLALLLAYVGGPGAVEVKMNGYVLKPSVLLCTCCIPPLPVNGMFVKWTKRMALQVLTIGSPYELETAQ
jgi:hypothetical protein